MRGNTYDAGSGWTVTWADPAGDDLTELLGQGWEPFAATETEHGSTVWLRRKWA